MDNPETSAQNIKKQFPTTLHAVLEPIFKELTAGDTDKSRIAALNLALKNAYGKCHDEVMRSLRTIPNYSPDYRDLAIRHKVNPVIAKSVEDTKDILGYEVAKALAINAAEGAFAEFTGSCRQRSGY